MLTVFESVQDFIYSRMANNLDWKRVSKIGSKRYGKNIIDIHCAFDTEFTRIKTKTGYNSYVYIWQFGIKQDNTQIVILERDIYKLHHLLQYLNSFIPKRPKNCTLQVGVHNLSCDFQQVRKHIKIDKIFAKNKREILSAESGNIKFIDTLAISGESLAKTAKDFTATQKLVGDLDYDLVRNQKTILTQDEKNYCINDVIIVCEYVEYLYNMYIPKGFFPCTKTQILRKMVQQSLEAQNENIRRYWKDSATSSFPETKKGTPFDFCYNTLMTYLFRGGFTHSNARYKDEILYNLFMIDFTSSYPCRMFTERFPCGAFEKMSIKDGLNSQHYIGLFRFIDLKAKTDHSLESQSKCVYISKCKIIDNGRIHYASECVVWLTELDFKNYDKMYSWKRKEILQIYGNNESHYLPAWFISILFNLYLDKDRLKKAKLPYALEKALLNSGYGLTVTKLNELDWMYSESEEIVLSPEAISYEDQVKKAILSPFWGIYISAYSRYELVIGIAAIGSDVAYYDTDSIKFLNYEKHKNFIASYNKERIEKTKTFCSRFNLDLKDFYDLGCYDFEVTDENGNPKGVEKFITLGAKRYLYSIDGKPHVTVAGLPKGFLENLYNNDDIYSIFKDNLVIENCKTTTIYNDEYSSEMVTDYQGNTCLMEQNSNMSIVPIDFTMSETTFKLNSLIVAYNSLIRGGTFA